jgi:UDP-2,3-diacylglucosamine pyrophosphatase LpxH
VNDRLILVSDVHLGGGTAAAEWGAGFADEFDEDEAFTEFLAYLGCRDDRPYRLVLLGDTFDFLRVPVIGARTGLYARDDAEASGQLELIRAAHPMVFGALAATLASGTPVDVVIGNHDVELTRPAVQDKLRALLGDHGCPAEALNSLTFHPWVYHVPGLLYAEHGNHYHDVNTFDRPLRPFRRGALIERPPAARLGGVRQFASARGVRPWLRDAVGDLLPRGRLDCAARAEYRTSVLAEYAAELGLAEDVVARLHQLGATSVLRIARRLVRARLAGGSTFPEQLPRVAASVHEVLSSTGDGAAFYVFGHIHWAQHIRLPATTACYLNTGTWSTDCRAPASLPGRRSPEPVRCTWVEIDRGGARTFPSAALMRWVGAPVALSGPLGSEIDVPDAAGRRSCRCAAW